MRIGWWAEASITPQTFVFGTPNNHIPLIREAERRGHVVELIHVPWKANGEWVLEKGPYEHLRKQGYLGDAINRRKRIEGFVRENSGLDASMRTFDAARAYCGQWEPDHLDHDVIFMKLPPPGFLRTKLEVVYNMWRFAKAGVPVFVFDGDLMWEQAVTQVAAMPWNLDKIHARTPYYPKKDLPNWRFQPYFYDRESELGVSVSEKRPVDLCYIGNDWKQEASPRAAGLAKFYGGPKDMICGRWTDANIQLTGISPDLFKGPIPAANVTIQYGYSKASVILGLPAYYKVGLVTQRYREIINGGCLALIDAAYEPGVSNHYVHPDYRVENKNDVIYWLSIMQDQRVLKQHVEFQREYVRQNIALDPKTWINALEHLANGEQGDVS